MPPSQLFLTTNGAQTLHPASPDPAAIINWRCEAGRWRQRRRGGARRGGHCAWRGSGAPEPPADLRHSSKPMGLHQ
eukprot:8360335-Pyramimonas_sp.AAC.1